MASPEGRGAEGVRARGAIRARRPSEEGIDAVMWHLTKRYGLLWWENGHHDIDHLLAKVDSEVAGGGGSENVESGRKQYNDELCGSGPAARPIGD